MLKIYTINDLQAEGLKIAKIKANRDLDEKNVKAKMEDLKGRGLIIPAMVVDAAAALEEKLELCEFANKDIVVDESNAKEYLVILDGQHRYEAHQRLLKEDPDYTRDFRFQTVDIPEGVTILDVLKAVNDPGHTWSLSDYTHSAWEINKENPTLSFIAELVAEGISYSASGKWSSLNRRLTPAMVKEAVNNEGSLDPLFVENKFLDAGKKLFEAAKKKLGKQMVKPRALVDWIIDTLGDAESKSEEIAKLLLFFEDMTKEQADELKQVRGKKNVLSKEEALRKQLDKLYRAFQNKSE